MSLFGVEPHGTQSEEPRGARLEHLIGISRHSREAIGITYLGQVGFLFQHRDLSVIIDPYLTYSGDESPDSPPGFWRRNYPPPIAPDCLHNIDLVLCTHDHLDHTDPTTLQGIRAGSPNCLFAGPHKSIETMVKSGIPREKLRTLNANSPLHIGNLLVEPVAAAHENYEQDTEGRHSFLGYVLHWGGRVLFHAGDTIPQEKLSADIAPLKIDIGFLPINGRSAARNEKGIVGNMDSLEAATFAVQHGFGLVVPTHFDLYSNNGASLIDFVRDLETVDPQQCFKVFRPGEQMLLSVLVS